MAECDEGRSNAGIERKRVRGTNRLAEQSASSEHRPHHPSDGKGIARQRWERKATPQALRPSGRNIHRSSPMHASWSLDWRGCVHTVGRDWYPVLNEKPETERVSQWANESSRSCPDRMRTLWGRIPRWAPIIGRFTAMASVGAMRNYGSRIQWADEGRSN
jgi:hypothetical protein